LKRAGFFWILFIHIHIYYLSLSLTDRWVHFHCSSAHFLVPNFSTSSFQLKSHP
jgi:hypothetical protein